ncbi:hypothetical protein TU60_16720 [Bacillus toyonensis]|nr:hypothetical protein TU60_17565 [Bacillus toyonensis]KMP58694.1 hypothetical protein TU60_16295 [Bacillus toyonensis]KMP58768.1 hypothetical protein TU60_16720 [Bacillus toyonensis]
MFIYSFVLKIVYRNYIREPHKQAIGDSRSKCLGGIPGPGLAGLCGDIWAWLDRAWSCSIGGYIDVQE